MSKKFFLMGFLYFALVPFATAQEVMDLSVVQKIDDKTPSNSKSEVFDQVVRRVSLENIEALIGREKTDRNRDLIDNKIIKNSNRYILSSKSSGLRKPEAGGPPEIVIDLKISLKNLRSMLLEEGLLYQTEGPPKLLPALRFVDRVGAVSYGWWVDRPSKDTAFLQGAFRSFQKHLSDELMKIGFFTLNPAEGNFGESLPEVYRTQSPQKGDLIFLGEFFKSSIVLRGEVIFRGKPNAEGVYVIDFRLEAFQTQNGRVLAEVVRVYETQPGEYRNVIGRRFNETVLKVSEDLSTQMNDAWKKGTFGASLVRLVVRSELKPPEIDEFKKMVVLQVRDVKALRERIMASRSTTFEVDSSVPTQQLAQTFRTAKFNQFKVQVQDVDQSSVTLKVSK